MANFVTAARLGLLLLIFALVYQPNPSVQLLALPVLLMVFAMDALDGRVARKRQEESRFGAVFDIAADRIIENSLWLVLVDLNQVPVWVAVVFLFRSFLVDSLRTYAASKGQTPFGMMRSKIGKTLVAGRRMRCLYGSVKLATFGWLLLALPLPALQPGLCADWQSALNLTKTALIWSSIVLCLGRGLPVVLEFVRYGDAPSAAP
jgi:CDP-diacylglycerol---glycerol-3-phosphate 3-phosphatidyltransferase